MGWKENKDRDKVRVEGRVGCGERSDTIENFFKARSEATSVR